MTDGILPELAKLGNERGLIGDIRLTPLEAYDVAFAFLTAYWERGLKKSEDIASLLSSMSRGVWADDGSADPAQLHDWMDAIARVKKNQFPSEGTNSNA